MSCPSWEKSLRDSRAGLALHTSLGRVMLSVVRRSSALSLQCQGLTHRRSAMQTRYTPEQGMGMLGLEQVQLFWERSLDTKVLIGWSADTIVISVRGTASLRNAIADIQVRADCASPHQGSAALQQPAYFCCHFPRRMPLQCLVPLMPISMYLPIDAYCISMIACVTGRAFQGGPGSCHQGF